MFQILGLLLFFVLGILIIGLFILFKILRFIGIGKKYNNKTTRGTDTSFSGDGESSESVVEKPKKKKVFDKNEGEYIDFEDV